MKVRKLIRLLEQNGWRRLNCAAKLAQLLQGHQFIDGVLQERSAAVGQTREEALELIREAIEFHLEALIEDGVPVPRPSSEGVFVEVGAA